MVWSARESKMTGKHEHPFVKRQVDIQNQQQRVATMTSKVYIHLKVLCLVKKWLGDVAAIGMPGEWPWAVDEWILGTEGEQFWLVSMQSVTQKWHFSLEKKTPAFAGTELN